MPTRTTPALDWLLARRTGILQALPSASTVEGSGSSESLSQRDDWLIKLSHIERFLVDAERELIEAHPEIVPASVRVELQMWDLGLLEDLGKWGSIVPLEREPGFWRPFADNRPIASETVDTMVRRQLVEHVAGVKGVVILTRRGRQRLILGEST